MLVYRLPPEDGLFASNRMNLHIPTSPHTFHIPTMGTGFTIDAALRVAPYGISSALSLVDDVLIEQLRQYYCEREGIAYEPIVSSRGDARSARITAYLNLLDDLVRTRVEKIKTASFESDSLLTKYFELLPAESSVRRAYDAMLQETDEGERKRLQAALRDAVVPGRIDVNIMATGDREPLRRDGGTFPDLSDASAALKGFADSRLNASIVLSAGFNPRLYAFAAGFDDFFPDADGKLRKQLILKTSNYRSAVIQGRFLAKHGLWISEFRVESGLNCGGHAFPNQAELLGPILREFKDKRENLRATLEKTYLKALRKLGRSTDMIPRDFRVTTQGGIGTHAEDQFLREHYALDGTGWGTPFLLVPEVTNVDSEHLEKLSAAGADDVFLSNSSPFGHPFWNLRNSASEVNRRARVEAGRPGASCRKGYCKLFNVEFTETPLCVASCEYQAMKLESLGAEATEAQKQAVTAKSCICHDLGGAVLRKLGIDPAATPAICPGPGISDFSKIASFREMVEHIYGKTNLVTNTNRPHLFLREVALTLDWLETKRADAVDTECDFCEETIQENLTDAFAYYEELAASLDESVRNAFLVQLAALKTRFETMPPETLRRSNSAAG